MSDPSDPQLYLKYLSERVTLDEFTEAYITEALTTYNSGCHKSSAVMIGLATECLILRMRDGLDRYLSAINATAPTGLNDWKMKHVREAMSSYLEAQKVHMPRALQKSFTGAWAKYLAILQGVRHDAVRPNRMQEVNQERIRSSLKIFVEFARLVSAIESWIEDRVQAAKR